VGVSAPGGCGASPMLARAGGGHGGPTRAATTIARRMLLVLAVLAGGVLLAVPATGQGPERPVLVADLDGTIDPATSGWTADAIEQAAERDARLLVLRMDTPGGLDASMRDIVRGVLASPVPVAVWVAPDGARAASAGMYITLAGHVAAMAPQTNIGSATPVTLGGGGDEDEVMGRKVRNDAAAYAAALAEGRGRDAQLAERMVRDAENVTAPQALEAGLIDVVAGDVRTLLAEIDGKRVQGPSPEPVLRTAGAPVEELDTPLRFQLQQLLFNPSFAYLLLLAGIAGLVLEALSPGLVGPGLFGAVALLLGLYGTAQLPVTAAGALLLLLGIAFLAGELFLPTGGLLAAAGAVALAGGGLLLFEGDGEVFRVSVPVALATGAASGAFTLFAVSKALALRSAPPVGGPEDLVGLVGTVRSPLDPVGQVYVGGALWRARTQGNGGQPQVGDRVRVQDVEGLTVSVRPVREKEQT
jgi:membrane-bound serine protease (ClpP class)